LPQASVGFVRRFDIKNLSKLPKAGVFMCHGTQNCGKSTLARELVQVLCQRGDVDQLLLMGDQAVEHHESFLVSPKTEVFLLSSSTALGGSPLQPHHLHRFGTRDNKTRSIVILMDCLYFSPIYETLFLHAKNWNVAVVATTCDIKSQTVQDSIDCLFTFGRDPQWLWKAFFSGWTDSFEVFEKILRACTANWECLVYDKSQPHTGYYSRARSGFVAVTAPGQSTGSPVPSSLTHLFNSIQGPKRFSLTSLPSSGVVVCNGPAGCGKSILARELACALWQRDGVNHVILVGTDAMDAKRLVPPSKVVLTLTEEAAESALQRILTHQREATPRESIVILLDQLCHTSGWAKFCDGLYSEAASLGITLVVTTSMLNSLTPMQRQSIDCLFTSNYHNKTIHQNAWTRFFQGWGTFEQFQELLSDKTAHYKYLVYDKTNPNTQTFYTATPPKST